MNAITITLSYAYNYGQWLQMYALHQFLKQNHIETSILNYQPLWNNTSLQIKSVRQVIIALLRHIRENKFKKDSRKYLQMTSICRSAEELSRREQPDVYIAGSDQIWNPSITCGYDDIFYLHFPTTANKMFYGASIGLDNISEDTVQKMVARIDCNAIISVREQSLCNILQNDTGLQISHVLDPVFLLNPQDYKKIIAPSKHCDYLLLYLMADDEKCYKLAKKIAREKKLKVIQVGKFKKRDGVDKAYATLSPTEFLGLLFAADYIVTNSFHGTAFAILFRKQFTTVEIEAVQSRITSLLNTMQLSHRCIVDVDHYQLEEINYGLYEQAISSAVQTSRQFLLDSLEDLRKE